MYQPMRRTDSSPQHLGPRGPYRKGGAQEENVSVSVSLGALGSD
jgi:hypothetical protein